MNHFLFYSLALLALIAVVHSITCWQDSSSSQSHSSSKRAVNCTGCSYCLKFYGKGDNGKASLWDCGCYVSPLVTPMNPGLNCLKNGKQKESGSKSTVEFNCCSTDKCNSAGTLTVLTAIATVVGAFFL